MDNKIFQRVIGVFICVVIVGSSLLGCSPAMRKKFVRQKNKNDKDIEFIPVLEPIDYPNLLETNKTRYDYFYALLKVWHKDVLMLINDEHTTDKQIVYAITQMNIQLEELDKIFDGKAKQKIVEATKAIDDVLDNYDKPASFRNRHVIRKELDRLTDSIIDPLLFENIKDDLKLTVNN